MELLVISLDAMTNILAAYPVRDLRHINHVLQRFEAIGADLPTIRRVVQGAIDREMQSIAPLRSRGKRKPSLPPRTSGPCPACGGLLVEKHAEDTNDQGDFVAIVTLYECNSCRWSAIVED
jgi:ssDNA-binding Zn-finger/Zn-ribbon topoisomerase 1